MTYVDGFLIPVPTKNLAAYRKLARQSAKLWREHGALDYRECVGDDLDCEHTVSFAKLAGAKKGESVVFAYITYRSKAERKRVNQAVMADPRMQRMMHGMQKKPPFDCTRMGYGGFKTLVGD